MRPESKHVRLYLRLNSLIDEILQFSIRHDEDYISCKLRQIESGLIPVLIVYFNSTVIWHIDGDTVPNTW
jgi:hypothetical protein